MTGIHKHFASDKKRPFQEFTNIQHVIDANIVNVKLAKFIWNK
jgi:hypothetical protein